jgi:cyclophilin family peptidyl-prolyl cis-trans isomerase
MIKRFLTWSFFIGALLGAPLTFAEQSSSVVNPIVVLRTNSGDISLELYADKSPITVANFLSYVDSGHYDNTIFHRVISNFMIQGGGYTPDLVEKPTLDPIVNESRNRLHNLRGTIAMARTSDPDSASSQFFINHRNNLRLDWAPGRDGYTVFGEVIDGMSTVDFIATAPTRPRGMHPNLPVDDIIILKAERVTQP